MNFARFMPLAFLALLAACGQAPEGGAPSEAMEAAAPAPADAAKAGDAVKVVLPQIAYSYRYGFDVPAGAITQVQQAHVAACDKLGPARCRVVEMQRSSADGGGASGSLKLQVDARVARGFGADLAKAVDGAGGALDESSTTSEDLSKKIVDTEARLRSKQALAGRLMQLLQSRNGTVAELVEAERKVAEVQEEIDAAQSWLAEMRGRVNMSAIDVDYRAGGGSGFFRPIREAGDSLGQVLGVSIAGLMVLVVGGLPWVLVIGLIVWLIRRARQKRRIAAGPPPAA